MILTILILIIISILLIFSVIQCFNILFRGYAPLFSTNKHFIEKILKEEVNIKPDSNVYELGCGFAKFLTLAEKNYPNANYIGIEYSFLPFFLTKIKLKFTKSKIKIINENFLKTNLSNADIIYCYLIPDIMTKLAQKLQNECKKDTLIISHRFSMPGLNLGKTINYGNNKFYFYKI